MTEYVRRDLLDRTNLVDIYLLCTSRIQLRNYFHIFQYYIYLY